MDLLKKILRHALTTQAQRIRFVVGSVPEISDAQGHTTAVAGLAAVGRDDLAQLFEFLFPNDRSTLASKQLARGALNVPNVGKIFLIAQPAEPASLRLYLPPNGEASCENDWGRLTNTTIAPDIGQPRTTASRLPATKSSATPQDVSQTSSTLFGSVDPAATGGSSSKPTVTEGQATGSGFIPLGLGATPGIEAVATTQASESGGLRPGIRPTPSPELAPTTTLPGMATTLSGSASTVHALPFAGATTVTAQTGSMLATPSPFSDSPFMATQRLPVAVPEESAQLEFGPDAGGLASKSYGQNPIDAILADMVARRASDLHMTCGEPYCFRIDGDITRIGKDPVPAQMMEQYLSPILPDLNRKELVNQNDTDFAYEVEGVGRFRVNIFRDRNGIGTVMRHIPSKILTAEQLNLPPAITKFCDLTKGLVLVTGPTGSGKSTTLAAMIDLINKNRSDHILTIEDPIEFVHPQQRCLVNQREVRKHTQSFSRALKAALREDPDIVLIGEMRDLETIAIALETAETGHLVFGTLHTTTAISTVDRIVDQFPSDRQEQIRMMLASSLRGVVAQTLLKKKSGGRVAAHEILVSSDAVAAMIREGKNHMISSHMQSQKGDGNQLLNEALAKLVKDSTVDAEEAYRKAVDKNGLADLFRRMNVSVPGMAAPAAAVRSPASGHRSA